MGVVRKNWPILILVILATTLIVLAFFSDRDEQRVELIPSYQDQKSKLLEEAELDQKLSERENFDLSVKEKKPIDSKYNYVFPEECNVGLLEAEKSLDQSDQLPSGILFSKTCLEKLALHYSLSEQHVKRLVDTCKGPYKIVKYMNEISSIIKKIRKEKVKDERKEKKKFYSDCQERLILNFEEVIGYYARNIEDIHSLNRRMFNKVNLELNNKISETVNLGSESLNETISHELGKSFRGLLQEITVFFTNTVIIGGINEAKIQPHSRYRDYVSETPNVRDFYNGNFSKRK